MTIWQAVISGFVQGICEFLPVSSSGHLVLLHTYFGFKEPQVLFDVFLHLGTLLAVFVYFRKDILLLLKKDHVFLLLVIAGCLPTVAIVFLFEKFFESTFTDIKVVGFMLIATALFLFAGDFASRKRQHGIETNPNIGFGKAVIIGLLQGFSVLPGLSRSGTTIATALILQVRKKEAIRYSFLMSIPIIIGAALFELKEVNSFSMVLTPQYVIGIVTAFLAGLTSIYYLLNVIAKDKLSWFGGYCIIAGAFVLIKTFI